MPRPLSLPPCGRLPKMTYFKPRGVPMSELAECRLSVDGLEALRLADYQDLNMDEAAARMGVSRHTFTGLRSSRCVAEALIEGHALRIEGGVCALVDTSETQGALDVSQSIHWWPFLRRARRLGRRAQRPLRPLRRLYPWLAGKRGRQRCARAAQQRA